MDVRALTEDDLSAYVELLAATHAESGRDGRGHAHVYDADEPFDVAAALERERARWSAALEGTGWRRAWGLFDGERLVGHLELVGGALPSETHRVSLGMAVRASHHRRGGGRALLSAALAWVREQPHIDWVDLGVFHDNPGARALYDAFGFSARGTTPDRFRVDGVSLADTAMSLFVGAA